MPRQQSFLYADQVLSQTGVKVQKMKDELSHAKADEEQLDAENAALKSQLEKWRAAGERVASREARAVELLQQGGAEKAPEASALAAATSAAAATDVSLLSRATGSVGDLRSLVSEKVPSSHGVWVAMTSIAFCVMLLAIWSAFELGGKMSKARTAWRGATAKAWSCASCGPPKCMTPMLRSMGAAHYRIEISEIHVGSLLGGGDVQVSVRVGEQGAESCTEVVRRCDGSFLRFSEAFVVDIRKGGQPLVVQVIDGRGKLASLRLPAREAINLSLRGPASQYYRSELVAEPALLQELSKETSDRKPYAAMKIRDLTSQHAGAVGAAAKQGLEGMVAL